jgi:hypothetical protein
MAWTYVSASGAVNTNTTGTTGTVTAAASVTAGNLVIIDIASANTPSISGVADSGSNTYTSVATETSSDGIRTSTYYSVVTTGGSLIVTATFSATSLSTISIREYSFTPGTVSVVTHAINTGSVVTAYSTGSMSFTGPVLGVGAVTWLGVSGGATGVSWSGGFTERENSNYISGTAYGLSTAEVITSTSPQNPGGSFTGGTTSADFTAVGTIFQSSGDVGGASFTVSPATIPAHHSGNITLTLTGTSTSWVSGTTVFTLPSITGLTKVSQSITSGTAATIVCTTGATTGSGNITDNTDSATAALTVSTATLAISPTSGGISTPRSIALTGTNTLWSSETASTLFTVSGGTSPSISSIAVTSNTAATATFNPGSTIGTITVTDSSTTAAASFTATGALAVSPTSVVQNSTGITLTLTGTGTSWTSGTPGSPTFTVSAGTITAQTVTSATSATLTYNSPAASASPVTITDPSTGATASLTIATSNLANGTASTVSVGNTIATVQVANATGGTPPYSYQWYRSTTSGFTPGGGNIVAGATNQTLNDTGLTNGLTYFYVNVVTDSA